MTQHRFIVIFTLTAIAIHTFFYPQQVQSANLLTGKDTIQSSRLSFAGRVKPPTATGGTTVSIYTSGVAGFYSISTAGLQAGDTINIGSGTYTIGAILNDSQFTVTSPLSAGDADDMDPIYFKSKPQHIITFNTVTAIPNGLFRVLLLSAPTNQNDGLPDSSGFDFNKLVAVSASSSAGYTFGISSGLVSGTPGCVNPTNYHCFRFPYSGPGGAGVPITLVVGDSNGTNTPIAPAPSVNHNEGQADTYRVIVQHFASGANPDIDAPVDKINAQVAVIETVRVSATVGTPVTATPPPGFGAIAIPTTIIPTLPRPSLPLPRIPITFDFGFFIRLILIFGLILHLTMAAYGLGTPLRFIPKLLLILAFPFLRKQKFQTVPFAFIEFYIPEKLGHAWQTVISDIRGFYSLRSPLPSNLYVELSAFGRKWNGALFKGTTIPNICLFPIPVDLSDSKRLQKFIYDARVFPLIVAVLTSLAAFFISPAYDILAYCFLSFLYFFSEYLYPRFQKDLTV